MIEYWLDVKKNINCSFTLNKLNNPPWYDAIIANDAIKKSISDETHLIQNTDRDFLIIKSFLSNSLMPQHSLNENNRIELLDSTVAIHEIYKKTRNIDYLNMWFYNTIEKLK